MYDLESETPAQKLDRLVCDHEEMTMYRDAARKNDDEEQVLDWERQMEEVAAEADKVMRFCS